MLCSLVDNISPSHTREGRGATSHYVSSISCQLCLGYAQETLHFTPGATVRRHGDPQPHAHARTDGPVVASRFWVNKRSPSFSPLVIIPLISSHYSRLNPFLAKMRGSKMSLNGSSHSWLTVRTIQTGFGICSYEV